MAARRETAGSSTVYLVGHFCWVGMRELVLYLLASVLAGRLVFGVAGGGGAGAFSMLLHGRRAAECRFSPLELREWLCISRWGMEETGEEAGRKGKDGPFEIGGCVWCSPAVRWVS